MNKTYFGVSVVAECSKALLKLEIMAHHVLVVPICPSAWISLALHKSRNYVWENLKILVLIPPVSTTHLIMFLSPKSVSEDC